MPKKNSKSLYVVVLLLFVGGLGYLGFTGFAEGAAYNLEVSEVLDKTLDKPQRIRLFGKVRAGYAKLEEGVGVRFQLEDKFTPARSIWTTYNGAVPDAFVPGADVIVEGIYKSGDAEFTATKLMTQCPSKYEKMRKES